MIRQTARKIIWGKSPVIAMLPPHGNRYSRVTPLVIPAKAGIQARRNIFFRGDDRGGYLIDRNFLDSRLRGNDWKGDDSDSEAFTHSKFRAERQGRKKRMNQKLFQEDQMGIDTKWVDDQGKIFSSVETVAVGEPTKASWANDIREQGLFLCYTRAPFVRGVCSDDGGYEAGGNSGIMVQSVGYAEPNGFIKLTDDEESTGGMNVSGTGFTYRMIQVNLRANINTTTLSAARDAMPGGSDDDWFGHTETTTNGKGLVTFWSKNGTHDMQSGRVATFDLGSSKFVYVFVSDGNIVGFNSNRGELILRHNMSGNYLAFCATIFAGPKWRSV